MSILRPDSVKVIAQTIGIHNLSDSVASHIAQDAEKRVREIIQEAKKFMRHSNREVLGTADIDCALKVRNVESLYGYSSSDPITFRRAIGQDDLFFIQDTVQTFDDVLKEPLPPPPADPTFSVHWLAVEGIQPDIPQNFPSTTTSTTGNDKKRSMSGQPTASGSAAKRMKPMVEHVLSKEQQLYYNTVTSAVKGDDDELRQAALKSLVRDGGLHQLVPYFTHFIADEVTHNLKKLKVLSSLMQMAHALILSPHLHIEPYLHQLMPSILTCLVGKQLCTYPDKEDHWSLRVYAAQLVHLICQQYGHAYDDLQPRITKTLARAFLSPDRPLTTHFGAIVGLQTMGHFVTRVLILPHLQLYFQMLEPSLASANVHRRMEARRCYGALLSATGIYLRREMLEMAADASVSSGQGSPPAASSSSSSSSASPSSSSSSSSSSSAPTAGSGGKSMLQEKLARIALWRKGKAVGAGGPMPPLPRSRGKKGSSSAHRRTARTTRARARQNRRSSAKRLAAAPSPSASSSTTPSAPAVDSKAPASSPAPASATATAGTAGTAGTAAAATGTAGATRAAAGSAAAGNTVPTGVAAVVDPHAAERQRTAALAWTPSALAANGVSPGNGQLLPPAVSMATLLDVFGEDLLPFMQIHTDDARLARAPLFSSLASVFT